MGMSVIHNMSTKGETFTFWANINSCMSNIVSCKLIARDAKKWAEKKVNGSERRY